MTEDQLRRDTVHAIVEMGGICLPSRRCEAARYVRFAFNKGVYELEFEIGSSLETGLPRALWVLHTEIGRALTLGDILKIVAERE